MAESSADDQEKTGDEADDTGADDEQADDGAKDTENDDAGDDDAGDGKGKTDDEADDADEGDKSKDGEEDKGDEADDGKKEPSKKEDEPGEPAVRKTQQDFIRERIATKQAKKSGQASEKKDDDEQGDDDGSGDDKSQDDIDAKIQKGIAAALDPILSGQETTEINTEVDKYLSDEGNKSIVEAMTPVDKERLRRWAQHPSRRQIPVNELAYSILGNRLLKVGAAKERQAGKKAAQTKGGGHSAGEAVGEKDPAGLPTKDFRSFKEGVKRKQRD